MKIIALEEHFATPEVLDAWRALDPQWQDLSLRASTQGDPARRLLDLDERRFAAMADSGVDVQVLSITTPGLQNLEPADAVALQTVTNDLLADTVRAHPDRLQGLAALATPAPDDAAKELHRAVTTLGLQGAMLFGRTRERNLDDPAFWPIFEAAEALNAPLYLHPQSPPAAVRSAYYGGFIPAVDGAFATFGLGWHYETGMQLLRLVLGGVFDRFPHLQVIAGHWGEVVLFYLERIALAGRVARLQRPLGEYFRQNVLVTPGGIFSHRYLQWAIDVVGADRVLFATDYPYELADGGSARRFLEEADLSDTDRAKIASGNWERICAGIRR